MPCPRLSPRILNWLLTALLLAISLPGCARYTSAPAFPAVPALTTAATPRPASQGTDMLILSIEDNGYAHLFAYSPANAGLTRLTWGKWSDVTPALSPDRESIALASNRGGYWDIYALNLQTGAVVQLTNSPAYDSAPSWSPDLAWIAYEALTGKEPFHSDNAVGYLFANCNEAAAPADQVRQGLPHELALVLARMLGKDPAQRYRSVQRLTDDLDRCAASMKTGRVEVVPYGTDSAFAHAQVMTPPAAQKPLAAHARWLPS